MASDYPLDSEGVWCELLARPPAGRAALFLDRDGVLIEDTLYLCDPKDIDILDGAPEVIARANALGIPVVVVTNQSGIGRGLYGWAEFHAVQTALAKMLADRGARVDAVFAVPHHHKGQGEYVHADHPARKPNPGMLLRARDAFGLDMKNSWMVGDHASDIQAAERAGLAGALHVLTGHGAEERPKVERLPPPGLELRLGASIRDAFQFPLLGS